MASNHLVGGSNPSPCAIFYIVVNFLRLTASKAPNSLQRFQNGALLFTTKCEERAWAQLKDPRRGEDLEIDTEVAPEACVASFEFGLANAVSVTGVHAEAQFFQDVVLKSYAGVIADVEIARCV